jgi:hypothetical protein
MPPSKQNTAFVFAGVSLAMALAVMVIGSIFDTYTWKQLKDYPGTF